MSGKMRTTCTWTERTYEALLFPGIGFGPFLCSLGGRVVAQRIKVTLGIIG
ncbi:hypothetical protein PVAP13_2KG262316 [Panicum virgatum]|uniref:Uncharacterized protein n=1 Tax=Panicum virgatum TaxID=38727 RepID=A0A8T0W481_PANVG|nr:hypothetical protein PVAP13_2KG262316 [Panicum virgatum]